MRCELTGKTKSELTCSSRPAISGSASPSLCHPPSAGRHGGLDLQLNDYKYASVCGAAALRCDAVGSACCFRRDAVDAWKVVGQVLDAHLTSTADAMAFHVI